ncbi:MAG: DUF1583 domain-containing protein, partial [Planctomycetaceae bacterium]|nr:DUF1583 domain-containing protein [Planctomycetaceae bacterium]
SLPVVLKHDFCDGLPTDWFRFNGSDAEISVTEDGVLISRVAGTTRNLEISTAAQLHGDFEITAEYVAVKSGDSSIPFNGRVGLRLSFDDEADHRTTLYRTQVQQPLQGRAAMYRSFAKPDGSRTVNGRYEVDDSSTGRLRLVRRGKTLSGYSASFDSANFHKIWRVETTVAPTRFGSLLLSLENPGSETISVCWRSLEIRAEAFEGGPVRDEAAILQRLSQRNAGFTETIRTYSDPEIASQLLMSESENGLTEFVADGLHLTAESTNGTAELIVADRLMATSEFDIDVALDLHQIAPPVLAADYSEVTFRAFFLSTGNDSQAPHEISMLIRQYGDGRRELVARMVRRDQSRNRVFIPVHTIPVQSPDRLRIARLDERLVFLYSEQESDQYRVVAVARLPATLLANTLQLSANTSGSGVKTDVTFQSTRQFHPVSEETSEDSQ